MARASELFRECPDPDAGPSRRTTLLGTLGLGLAAGVAYILSHPAVEMVEPTPTASCSTPAASA